MQFCMENKFNSKDLCLKYFNFMILSINRKISKKHERKQLLRDNMKRNVIKPSIYENIGGL